MKTSSRVFTSILTLLLILSLFLMLSCEKAVVTQPIDQAVQIQPKFLKSLNAGFDKPFLTEQYVAASAGGIVSVGDDVCGYSELVFLPGDLPADTTIVFGWDSQGYITDLGPHGIVFNGPVVIRLSYKDADLTGVNEDNLRIWYYDEQANEWELIGGTVNKNEKLVEGTVEHFSRYAIGEMP